MPQTIEKKARQVDDAERGLLGAIMLAPVCRDEVQVELPDGSAEFYSPRRGVLYDAMISCPEMDQITMRRHLENRGDWTPETLVELASLMAAVPSTRRAVLYAKIVHDAYTLRRLSEEMDRIQMLISGGELQADRLLQEADATIVNLMEKRATGPVPIGDLMDELLRELEARGENGMTGLPTGLEKLDDLTGGLQPSELIVVAGRPSMGKSALGLHFAKHLTMEVKVPVLLFTLEMSDRACIHRIVCARAGVSSEGLRSRRLSDPDRDTFREEYRRVRRAPLYLDDSTRLMIGDLRARARVAQRRHGIRCIIIDYMQLLHAPRHRGDNREQEVSDITHELKALAKDLRLPVVAVAQLNRGSETGMTKPRRPRLSDLRESGTIEQDADVVVLLHREGYYAAQDERADDGVAELIVAKQRMGPVGVARVWFEWQYARFSQTDPSLRHCIPSEPEPEPVPSEATQQNIPF